MTDLEETPKRSQVLAQLERVCRIHHALADRRNNRPYAHLAWVIGTTFVRGGS